MFIHVALFKWKKGVSKNQIKKALNEIVLLKNELIGITNIYAGKNFHDKSKGFTHAIVVIADTKNALVKYRKNPKHLELAKIIEENYEDALGVDFKNKTF